MSGTKPLSAREAREKMIVGLLTEASEEKLRLQEHFNRATDIGDIAERYLSYHRIEQETVDAKTAFKKKFHDAAAHAEERQSIFASLMTLPVIGGSAFGGGALLASIMESLQPDEINFEAPVYGAAFSLLGMAGASYGAIRYSFLKHESRKRPIMDAADAVEDVFHDFIEKMKREQDLLPSQDPRGFGISPHFSAVMAVAPHLKKEFENIALQQKLAALPSKPKSDNGKLEL